MTPLTLHRDKEGRVWARLHEEGKMDIVVEVEPDSDIHRFLLATIRVYESQRSGTRSHLE